MNENYDWQLFDVTGRNPVDVFTSTALFVACNWSSDPGETGASPDGTNYIVCAGPGQPLFSKMPDLVVGHEYLLMISHHDNTSSGFQMIVTGGTASITDPVAPRLLSARLSCDGTKIIAKLSRGMRCNSLAPDGSDFTVNGGTSIISATSTGCSSNLTTDSIVLSLASPLLSGNYTLIIQNGNDGNTLIDNCSRGIPAGDQVSFIVSPLQPTPLDSIKTPGCAPAVLQLIFRRPIQCFSIAPNGSDFILTGPQAVAITKVTSSCNTGTPLTNNASIIDLHLSSPLIVGGIYQIKLTTGSDGNTIVDECGRITPAGSVISFTVKDTVSALFTWSIKASCQNDTLSFLHDGSDGVNSWDWSFDNGSSNNFQNPVQVYPASGQHTARLIVSNGGCKDTASVNILLDNKVKAEFESPDIICPEEVISFINRSSGNIDNWEWNFGNGNTSNLKTPQSQHYSVSRGETFYIIKLIASSTTMNCRDSVSHIMRALASCYVAVPSAFTPNGDGVNDYLYPLNGLKADHLEFKVYNRFGQLVFETKDWTKKWDGRINGLLQNTGAYAWILSFTHHDTGKKVFMKGITLLIR
jgi:gliding motility-associated-like protein